MKCSADRAGRQSANWECPDLRRGNRRPFRIPSRKAQRSVLIRIVAALAASLAAMVLLPGIALAIGNSDQKIVVTAGLPGPLNASGVLSAGLNAKNQPNSPVGTGTVIGVKEVGNTAYVAILTANHVVASGVTTMSLGAGPGSYDISFPVRASATFTIVDAANNPLMLPEDVSVLQGRIDLTQGNNREYVEEVLENSLPKITVPNANPLFGATIKNQVPFTEIGYGTQGTNVANALYFPVANSVGSRLFQNNLATAYLGNVASPYSQPGKVLPYFEPLDNFKVLVPPAGAVGMAQGYGAALGGDSGGPLYTAGTITNIPVTRGGNNLNIPIYTDSLSAIVVAGASPTIVNSLELAVPIDQSLYNWIQPLQQNPQSIPEPASVVLLGIGAAGLVAWRCRRRAGFVLRNALSNTRGQGASRPPA